MSSEFRFCEVSGESELVAFEKATYEAYHRMYRDIWPLDHMEIIDDCRLRPAGIDHCSVLSYALMRGDEFVAGLKINHDLNAGSLTERWFDIGDVANEHTVEGINFFTNYTGSFGPEFFTPMETFFGNLMDDLKQRGFSTILGVAHKRLRIFYRQMGFESIRMENDICLLRYTIE